jgi:hypothetical protein
LASVDADFAAARQAGVKLIPRFAYNFDQAGPDAPLDRIQKHLAQLAPILQKNSDVLAFVQAGFIGRWGEWHDSSNDLDNTVSRLAVTQALLKALPQDRMVVLRYPEHKMDIFGSRGNLSAAEAFGSDPRARVGFHNDCFLASDDDWGTYFKNAPETVQAQKAWLARETRYVVMGGETCNLCARSADCKQAIGELAQFHYSELNSQYEPKVLKTWEDKGCMGEARRRLGYRLRLVDAELPETASRGQAVSIKLELTNDGFAAPYNPRPVELILRGSKGGPEIHVPVKADPRLWMPGEKQELNVSWAVPAGQAPDKYYVFLNLPDASPALSRRPEYSIRLANQGLWEARSGYNWLRGSIILN